MRNIRPKNHVHFRGLPIVMFTLRAKLSGAVKEKGKGSGFI